MGILMLNGHNYTGGIQQVYGKSSGNIATFDDGGDNKPLKSLKVAINPVQASGTPSPSNPLPISGWTEANVTRTGKNLWGGEKLADDIVVKVPNATKNTTNKTVTYTASQVSNKVLFDNFKENTQYTFYMSTESSFTNLRIWYSDETNQIIQPNTVVVTQSSKTVDRLAGVYSTGSTALKYDECGIYEGAITAQDFKPYNGTTYPITWSEAGEEFGGYIEFKDGEWKAYKTHKEVDLGTLTYTYHPASGQYTDYYDTNSMPSDCQTGNRDVASDMYCSIYSAITSTNIAHTGYDDNVMAIAQSTRRLIICDQRFTSASDLRTALSGVNLIYPLATPIEFDLDEPVPTITTLLGDNNIWSDTGEILECVYQRDLNIVINQFDERITALEQALSGTRSLSLSKSAVKEEETNEEITEEPKEEEQNEDKR